MNVFKRFLQSSKSFCNVRNVTLASVQIPARFKGPSNLIPIPARHFSLTVQRFDLAEFFDDKKNLGENEVKHGRAWNKDELRIKSNSDLHKLWFVLLKERNMLLTMEHECNEKMELFPSPERLDKVNISMKNLEDVVRERNRAYYELETGETGERPGKLEHNQLGLKFYYRMFEHVIPKYANKKWNETHKFSYRGAAVTKFLRLYREKLYNVKRKHRNRDRNEVIHLLKRFPNMDRTMIAEKYPSVNIEKLLKYDRIRGNHESIKA
ncbi:large ribosomal subunit protein uL29m [Topomyia yanbarensis]|uniref:large ribosomal subunit protein uL29m n=1 Tax=Topomyia yanbarensis TaxID=2498891 RepID=UPI00273C58A0|nr:large ribosomal subunit protein uL29m [Topomyia yanbarensis]